MRIKEIETFVVRAPLEGNKPHWGAGFWASDPRAHPGLPAGHPGDISTEYPPIWRNRALYARSLDAAIVRLETDTGIVGWGEAHTPVAPEAAQAVVDYLLKDVVYGRDPFDIWPIWENMYSTMRLRGHSAGFMLEAMSAVDIALWDITGKALGVPVAKLLGGQMRDRVPVYASSLPRVHISAGEAGWRGLAEMAARVVEEGYRAFKVKLGIDLEQDRHALQVLRAAVGPDISIFVDVNGAYDLPLARKAGHMMQQAGVLWLEEPFMPENLRDYARLAQSLDVMVAGGECLCNRWVFNDFLVAGAMDLVQPDVSRAGGISESKRISDLADTYAVPFAPHVSVGTAIYMAASLQWAAAGPNLMICEWPLEQTVVGNGILVEPFRFDRGFIQLSDEPGLGIVIDEEALRQWQV
ncbi:MAG: mandelate racemase/muconate lactonizing enzyme family protein [Ardenticatenaceae bacterium]|nr:mandelate racemase/muconate lactonizing enzyme family protein [Ardenticatenaceae bacterium]